MNIITSIIEPNQEGKRRAISIKSIALIFLIISVGIESFLFIFALINLNQMNYLYQDLLEEYQDSQEEYQDLQEDYQDSQALYQNLLKEYNVEKCLRIGNSLASYYDYIRQELGEPEITSVEFAADLGLHDLRRLYWPILEQDYYDDVGEYSYDTASEKINDVVKLIGIRDYDSSTEKIRKILEFIVTYISYEPEVNEVFLAPVETLGFKSGDCDDFTILAATLFEAVEIDAAVGFFDNEQNEGHAMTLIHLEKLTGYGYWYFTDLTHRGLEEGKWIVIEAQIKLDEQNIDWIGQWDLDAVAALDVAW